METSKPYRILFFTKEGCTPCIALKKRFTSIYNKHPQYAYYVSVLDIEHHTALRDAYEITDIPTVVILDNDLKVISKLTGINKISKTYLNNALFLIHQTRNL